MRVYMLCNVGTSKRHDAGGVPERRCQDLYRRPSGAEASERRRVPWWVGSLSEAQEKGKTESSTRHPQDT